MRGREGDLISNSNDAQLISSLQDHASVLVEGTCQIPDPVYKFVGSIVCFYIPLGVMLLTYTLTVQLLANQQQNLSGGKPSGGGGWSSGWMGIAPPLGELRRKSKSVPSLIFIPVRCRTEEHMEAVHQDEFAVDAEPRTLCGIDGH